MVPESTTKHHMYKKRQAYVFRQLPIQGIGKLRGIL